MTARRRSRAPWGTGSPPQLGKDGYYHAYVEMPPKPDGERVRKHIKRRSREACMEAYRIAQRMSEKAGVAVASSARGTAGEWFIFWLNEVIEPTRKNATYSGHEGHLRRVVLPSIGAVKLADLTEDHIRDMLETVPTVPTQRAVLRVVSASLNVAWERRLVTENVARRVVLARRNSRAVIDDDDFEDEEIETVRNKDIPIEHVRHIVQVESHKWDNGYRWVMQLVYGLRQGETLGLCFTDADFEARELRILRNLGRSENAWRHGCYNIALCGSPAKCPRRTRIGRVDTTKTAASKRELPLTEEIVALIKEQRRRQVEKRLASAQEWPRREWMFTSADGKPLDHRNDFRQWKTMLRSCGLPESYTLHAMRHTAATRAGGNGADIYTIQTILGWSSPKMAGRYVHGVDDRIASAVERQVRDMFGM